MNTYRPGNRGFRNRRTVYVEYPPRHEETEGEQYELRNWLNELLKVEPPQALNPQCQLRFKEVPEIQGENAKQIILDLIKLKTQFELNPDNLVHAERFPRWDNVGGPRDIRVIFENKNVRDHIYAFREYILNGKSLIIDELDELNRVIWRESVTIYGLGRVFTENGKVTILAENGFCYTMESLRDVYCLAYCDGKSINNN